MSHILICTWRHTKHFPTKYLLFVCLLKARMIYWWSNCWELWSKFMIHTGRPSWYACMYTNIKYFKSRSQRENHEVTSHQRPFFCLSTIISRFIVVWSFFLWLFFGSIINRFLFPTFVYRGTFLLLSASLRPHGANLTFWRSSASQLIIYFAYHAHLIL